MFNIFKKVTIEQIHAEFDSAQDRLLQQAMDIIPAHTEDNSAAVVLETAERLKRLGFTNTALVKKANDVLKEKEEKNRVVVNNKEQADVIQYYSQNYPFLKFLTESELDRICEKYNLIYAPTSNYIKDVPEKNLKEIENAQKLNNEDTARDQYFFEVTDFYSTCPNEIKKILKGKVKCDFTYESETDAMKLARSLGYNGKYNHHIYREAEIHRIHKKGLFIAAPSDHFDTTGLDKKGKFGYMKKTIIKIEDPIVFRYVRGGIQVLSKWGAEGNDPSLIVPQLN